MKTPCHVLITLFLMLFMLSGSLLAQAPDTVWTRTYGGSEVDAIYGVVPLPSGSFMCGGYTPHDVGLPDDMWYFRVNADGHMVWEDKIGLADQLERAYTLEPALDGELILAGDLIQNDTLMKVYIVKADSNGNGWGFTYGSLTEDTWGRDAVATWYGGVLAVGYQTESHAGSNVYMVGTFPTGLYMWHNVFSWGWTERANAVDRTDDGGYVVVGETNSYGSHTMGMFLQKFDSLGFLTGFQLYTWEGDQYAECVRQTLDGGYIIVGSRQETTSPDLDIVVIKTDSNATEEWRKIFDSPNRAVATDVQVLPDGGYILTGTGKPSILWHSSDVVVHRLDSNGDSLWTKYIGAEWNNETAYQIRCLPDGGYILAGARKIDFGNSDGYLIRLGPDPVTSIPPEPTNVTQDFILHQNYPNPFNPQTVISWQLAVGSPVSLTIYNPAGQRVAILVNERKPAGKHSIKFDASSLASGIYYYQLQAGNYMSVKKMILLK
jgi:hypothetical protein